MSYKGPIDALESTVALLSLAAEQSKRLGQSPTPFYRNRKYVVRLLKKYRRYITLNRKTKTPKPYWNGK